MRGKLLFVVGIGTGYVLGSRAGKQRYEQIKAGADKVWSSQPVRAGRGQVGGFLNQRLDRVSGSLANQVRKVLGSLLGLDKQTAPRSTPRTSASAASVNVGSTSPGTPPVGASE